MYWLLFVVLSDIWQGLNQWLYFTQLVLASFSDLWAMGHEGGGDHNFSSEGPVGHVGVMACGGDDALWGVWPSSGWVGNYAFSVILSELQRSATPPPPHPLFPSTMYGVCRCLIWLSSSLFSWVTFVYNGVPFLGYTMAFIVLDKSGLSEVGKNFSSNFLYQARINYTI